MKVERRNTKESGGKEHKAGSCATEWAQQSQRRTADSKSAAVKDSLRHRRLHCAGGGGGGISWHPAGCVRTIQYLAAAQDTRGPED